MASDDSGTGLPPERQRPAPTIDLKANEVSSRTIGGEAPPPDQSKASETATDQAPDSATSAQAASEKKSTISRPLHARPVFWTASACAAIILFGLGLWLGVSWMNRDDQLTQIAARLVRVETVLATAPATDTAMKMTAENVASLNKRLDEIAKTVGDARSRADAAAATADAAQKAAGNAPAGQGDTEALSNRIATLEQSVRAKERDAVIDDKVSRRAVVASALRDAVERGNPFAAELAAAKLFVTDAGVLAPLEDVASTGVPSTIVLARELSALVEPMMKAISGEPAREGGVIDKLQASARRLVRSRPIGEMPGDEPATIIARIEAKAARNDISSALAELAKLPPPVRAPAEDWIKRAIARDAALAASRQFAQQSLGAFGKPTQ